MIDGSDVDKRKILDFDKHQSQAMVCFIWFMIDGRKPDFVVNWAQPHQHWVNVDSQHASLSEIQMKTFD